MEHKDLFVQESQEEKIVDTQVDAQTGEARIVKEIWAEPKVQKRLAARVVEYKKPFVYRRETELVDENGVVAEKQVEKLDTEEVVMAASYTPLVSAAPVPVQANYLTKEDVEKMMSQGFISMAKMINAPAKSKVNREAVDAVTAFQALEERVKKADNGSIWKMAAWGAFAIVSGIATYLLVCT